ncbi:MAG: hypothetical protein JW841_06215 [Deltaproteobacteria bacterium]|nr:hypothetical protein [Deltaproteobacteria bacterium]
MPEYSAILRTLSAEKFVEVLSASSRKARETYFHRHNVRAPQSSSRLPKPGAKNEARTAELFRLLQNQDDDELCEEILRTFLLTKRAMLAKALDHLGIPHQDGLTESEDVSKFEKLSAKDIRALVKVLDEVAPKDEITIYLKFMGAADVDKALS